MADRITVNVHITPKETLTDEQGNSKDVISGMVGTSLGGSGDTGGFASSYSGSPQNQGYLNAAVNYHNALHTGEGVKLSFTEPLDFAFIKNPGFKFSSSVVLGDSTTDCIMVVAKVLAHVVSTQAGWKTRANTLIDHYFMLAWLKPGQAIVLPGGGITTASAKYDLVSGNANELSYINDEDTSRGDTQIYCKTFASDGTAATDGNALEFLAVT